MSVFGYSGLDRGYVCEKCLSINPSPTNKSPCRKCGHGLTADDVLADLISLDQDKSIRITFDPLPHKGASVDKTVGEQVYRIIRLR